MKTNKKYKIKSIKGSLGPNWEQDTMGEFRLPVAGESFFCLYQPCNFVRTSEVQWTETLKTGIRFGTMNSIYELIEL